MKYIGHRGYRKLYLENTLPGFQAVIDYSRHNPSIIGIELDIHFTSDGRIPVLHDTRLGAGGETVDVCALGFDEVRGRAALRAKRPDLWVPSLEETLSLVNHQVALYLEIKEAPYDRKAFGKALGGALRSYKPRKDIVLHSFSWDLVSLAMQAAKGLDVEFGFLFTEMERLAALPATTTKDLSYLHPHYSLLLKEPDAVFARGLPVNTWTVNERPVLTSLRAMEPRGMRSIMTDDLSLAETEHRTHG